MYCQVRPWFRPAKGGGIKGVREGTTLGSRAFIARPKRLLKIRSNQEVPDLSKQKRRECRHA